MTVRELIERLKRLPHQEATVLQYGNETSADYFHIHDVQPQGIDTVWLFEDPHLVRTKFGL